MYLTAVIDVANRRVLAQKVAITLKACHACEFIEQAYARFGVPEIVNTIRAASSQSKTSPMKIPGAPRVAHSVGRFVASADRRRGQLCTASTRPQSLYH